VSSPAATINMRTDPRRKQRLQLAADLAHESLTSFVLTAADDRAERVLSEARTTPLPGGFFDEFFDSLAPEPTPALVSAVRRQHRLVHRG
jgi:uncharacterized protein (DUF1778 family)